MPSRRPVWTTQKLCDAVRFLQEPVLQAAPASPSNTAVASSTELSKSVAQVAEAVREVKASTSQRAGAESAPHKLADNSVTPLVGSSGPRHVVRLLARVLRPAALSQTSARKPVHETWWLLVRAQDQVRVSAWPWLELPGSRLTTASGGAAHTFDASWSDEFNTVAGDDHFWAAQVRYPASATLTRGCEACSADRRRVSRVAVRACRRQWPSEA